MDEDDSRRELVESDQEEMVQASDSEIQVKLHDSFSLPLTKCITLQPNIVKPLSIISYGITEYNGHDRALKHAREKHVVK